MIEDGPRLTVSFKCPTFTNGEKCVQIIPSLSQDFINFCLNKVLLRCTEPQDRFTYRYGCLPFNHYKQKRYFKTSIYITFKGKGYRNSNWCRYSCCRNNNCSRYICCRNNNCSRNNWNMNNCYRENCYGDSKNGSNNDVLVKRNGKNSFGNAAVYISFGNVAFSKENILKMIKGSFLALPSVRL